VKLIALRPKAVVLLFVLLALTAVNWTPIAPLAIKNVTPLFEKNGVTANGVVYWVPADAPLASMSAAGSSLYHCSAALTAWLNKHASKVVSPQEILLNNTTSDSQTLTFSVADAVTSKAARGFYLQCGLIDIFDSDGTLSTFDVRRWVAVRLNLLQRGEIAAVSYRPPESDFSMTVRPGEEVGLTLVLQGPWGVSGELLVNSNSSSESASTIVPILERRNATSKLNWPGAPAWSTLIVHPLADANGVGDFYCKLPETAADVVGTQCSANDILATIRRVRHNPEPSESSSSAFWPIDSAP
jgi:hypothetical protein